MFDELDPGLPMMIIFLVSLFITIVWIDLQSKTYWALLSASILGFYIILSFVSFRYHCVAKDVILSNQTAGED